jgi:hypothetical protein
VGEGASVYLEAELNDGVLTGARRVICRYEAGELVEAAVLAEDVARAAVQMKCVGLLISLELVQPPPELRISSSGFGIQGFFVWGNRTGHTRVVCLKH